MANIFVRNKIRYRLGLSGLQTANNRTGVYSHRTGGHKAGFATHSSVDYDAVNRICLLPDTRGQVQSKFRKRTCNPKFDESFVFQVKTKHV